MSARRSRRLGAVELPVGERRFELLADELHPEAWRRVQAARERASAQLGGRRVWNVSSTARGGGVAEVLRSVLPYWRASGVDARWLVIEAPASFFGVTKRLHNMLHGVAPRGRLSVGDRELYTRVVRALGGHVTAAIAAGDVVVLHDPQTAGLAPILKRAGAVVVWRCHVGADQPSPAAAAAWEFLAPDVEPADAYVFTRQAFVPAGLDLGRTWVIPPAIDPCSPKNQRLAPDASRAILSHVGLADAPTLAAAAALRTIALVRGGHARVRRRARIWRDGAPANLDAERLVVAVQRWDRLKDPVGVMHSFAAHVADERTRLIVAGPAPSAVADDPEGVRVLREVRASWEALPAVQRHRIDVAVLPMADLDENALIVNALQRHAAVVVKKSIQEGFGLGVTEALWKARPVVATRVGGHQEQITDHRTGLLIDDPTDPQAFGAAVSELLRDTTQGLNLGVLAREEVRRRFLADRHFVDWTAPLTAAIASPHTRAG